MLLWRNLIRKILGMEELSTSCFQDKNGDSHIYFGTHTEIIEYMEEVNDQIELEETDDWRRGSCPD